MKRVGLRIALAEAVDDALWNSGYSLTLDNAKNKVSHHLLRAYRIRVTTPIYDDDWLVALHLAKADRRERRNPYFDGRKSSRHDRMLALAKTVSDARMIRPLAVTHPS